MDKKGKALEAVAIIMALTILGFFLVSTYMQECKSNKDCSENAYCGVDHECHNYPDKIVVKQNNFLPAAIVLGVALIAAAYIFKGGMKLPFKKY